MGISQSVMGFGALEKISDYGVVLNGAHDPLAFDGLTMPTSPLDLRFRETGFNAARLATSESALAAGLVSLYTQGATSAASDMAL
jgi:hypothetical protein